MVKIVYLDVDEEITSVIDKIKKIKSQDIALYFPKRAILIQSIVNLKILKKQVELLGKNVVLITTDETGLNLAKKSGFKATKSLKKKEQVEKVVFNEEKPKIDIKKFLNEKKEKQTTQSKTINFEDKKISTNSTEEDKVDNEFLKTEKLNENVKKEKTFAPDSSFLKLSKDRSDKPAEKSKLFSNFLKKSKASYKSKKISKRPKKDKVVLLPSLGIKTFLIFCLISFVVVGIIFFVVLPKATVSVVPKTEPFSRDLEITIENDIESINYENQIIPGEARAMEVKSKKEKFESTGEKNIGGKSRGEIILYNSLSSESQILVASTRFQNSGKIFYSLSEVTIPGAKIEGGDAVPGETSVIVEAEQSGKEYNLGPARYNIPGLPAGKQTDIFGKSAQAFSGGTSETKKVISEDDMEKAKESLMADTLSKGMEDLKNKASDNEMFAEGAIKNDVIEVKTSNNIGDEADDFEMEIKLNLWTMFFAKKDLKDIIFSNLHKDIPQEKFFVNEDVEQGIAFESLSLDSGNNIMVIKAHIAKSVAWKLDEKTIRRMLKGKTSDEVRKYLLENASVGDVNVVFWPFWVKRVPQLEKKIKFVLDTSKITDKIIK